MSHIVIHDDSSNVTQYARFDDLQAAAAYLEELHNSDGATNARLYALDEVQFAVKSYVKVEIGGAAPAPISDVEPAPMFTDVTPAEPAVPVHEADDLDTVEYVEAAMVPADSYGPAPEADEGSSGEVRRGLFGR